VLSVLLLSLTLLCVVLVQILVGGTDQKTVGVGNGLVEP
jgi:hypothetical protein